MEIKTANPSRWLSQDRTSKKITGKLFFLILFTSLLLPHLEALWDYEFHDELFLFLPEKRQGKFTVLASAIIFICIYYNMSCDHYFCIYNILANRNTIEPSGKILCPALYEFCNTLTKLNTFFCTDVFAVLYFLYYC